MEDRKSVLETTKPSDSITRFNERQGRGKVVFAVISVLLVLGLIYLIVTILENTTRGTEGVRVPSVTQPN